MKARKCCLNTNKQGNKRKRLTKAVAVEITKRGKLRKHFECGTGVTSTCVRKLRGNLRQLLASEISEIKEVRRG